MGSGVGNPAPQTAPRRGLGAVQVRGQVKCLPETLPTQMWPSLGRPMLLPMLAPPEPQTPETLSLHQLEGAGVARPLEDGTTGQSRPPPLTLLLHHPST